MNKDQFYRYVISILKELQIPFTDPCDANYVGDCGDCSAATPVWAAETFVADGLSNSVTIIGTAPQAKLQTFVFIGGQKIPTISYTLVGSVITFSGFSLNNGDTVEVQYVNY
jgi:hypothetical protein